jgi:cell division septum initiation protein DivIVA
MDGLLFLLDQAGRNILALQEENHKLREQLEALSAQMARLAEQSGELNFEG